MNHYIIPVYYYPLGSADDMFPHEFIDTETLYKMFKERLLEEMKEEKNNNE